MLVMTLTLHLAKRVKVQRHDYSSLRTRKGAELAVAAYAEEKNKPAEGLIVEGDNTKVTLKPMDRHIGWLVLDLSV